MTNQKMKAAICSAYGPPEVIEIKQIEKPQPGKNELLVQVKASAVNSGDARVRGLEVNWILRLIMRFIFGFKRPRKGVLGTSFSGVVVQTGPGVSNYKNGEEVFGLTGFKFGAHAEYLVLKENDIFIRKPVNASFEEAAALPFGAQTAIYFLSKTKLVEQRHLKVLIYGASGSVGCAAIQVAKHFLAEVTAVCSDRNLPLVFELGADHALAYNRDNLFQLPAQFDIVFDAVGSLSKKDAKQLLNKTGTFCTVGGPEYAIEKHSQLELVKHLFETGVYKAVIEKVYPLDAIVEAYRLVDSGRKRGNVVVRIN